MALPRRPLLAVAIVVFSCCAALDPGPTLPTTSTVSTTAEESNGFVEIATDEYEELEADADEDSDGSGNGTITTIVPTNTTQSVSTNTTLAPTTRTTTATATPLVRRKKSKSRAWSPALTAGIIGAGVLAIVIVLAISGRWQQSVSDTNAPTTTVVTSDNSGVAVTTFAGFARNL